MFESIKRMFGGEPEHPEIYEAPSGIPEPDELRHLVLYQYPACPYCRVVTRLVSDHGIPIEIRDTRQDPSARSMLRQRTGRTQVPCMFIDDVPFFESRDIKRWLQAYVARGHHQL